MAIDQSQSTFKFAIAAWLAAFSAMRRMPVVFIAAFVAVIAVTIATAVLAPSLSARQPSIPLDEQVWGFVLAIVQSFLLTPMIIAVHRFVLLGEITRGYWFNVSAPRFWRFFIFSIILQLMFFLPTELVFLSSGALGYILALLGFLGAAIAAVRMLLIFPAIAIDAPGANWRNAMQDSKGHGWRIFWILFIIVLFATAAIMAIAAISAVVIVQSGKVPFVLLAIDFLTHPLLSVGTIAANAVAASWFYQFLGTRLNQPGEGA